MIKTLFFALMPILGGCVVNYAAQTPVPLQLFLARDKTAKILSVMATGTENKYDFVVTVSSPDTGCEAYANWWEVLTPEGELLYRRTLFHSHVDEQPFTRTGKKVTVSPEQPLIIRVHMSDSGYSPLAQQGTVQDGFSKVTLPTNFAASLAEQKPLPGNCAF